MVSIPAIFDLEETLDCGQAFRWTALNDERTIWEGVASGKYLRLEQKPDSIVFHCGEESGFWKNYFDLSADYVAKRKHLASLSPALKEAVEFAPGIRILNQDPWEATCSFIISQNNHIPRIKGIISRLCENFGQEICRGQFSFPSAEKIAALGEDELSVIRAGFRHRYILSAAEYFASGKIDAAAIRKAPIEYGRRELMQITGVGPKVAECALLFGFHKTEGFPMDTWMKKAMSTLFPDKTPADFGADAGLAQQYIFHYSRMHPELFKEAALK